MGQEMYAYTHAAFIYIGRLGEAGFARNSITERIGRAEFKEKD